MAATGVLAKNAQDRYGEDPDTLIPRLMLKNRPGKIAGLLGVYPNTIYTWLATHGWDFINGVWMRKSNEESAQQ